VLCSSILFWVTSVSAAPPTVDYLFPSGGQRGTSVQVTATGGKFEPWPAQFWVDSPALKIQAGKEPGTFTVQIDKDATAGPHLIRIFNGEGAAMPRCFIVGDQPEALEAEPNDEVRKAQVIKSLPITINGRLDKSGDVDCYAVTLEAGQRLVASVNGRRLGSPIDPMLHLLDDHGREVAFANDGLGLDPLLVYRAASAGKYIVRISAFAYPPAADVNLAGGKGSVYRLSLTTGAFVRYAFPAGVVRGKRSTIQLCGWNLGAGEGLLSSAEVDASSVGAGEDHLYLPVPGGEGRVHIEMSDGPELLEAEAKSSKTISAPVNISGRIEAAGEEDRFAVTAKKGEKISYTLRAAGMGSALSGVIRLEDPAGIVLAHEGDNSNSPEPRLEWTAGEDKVFQIVVSDLYHKGGGDYFYRLEIAHPVPGIAAAADAHEYRLMAGKTAAVKLTMNRRNGHATTMVAVATGLPPGVTATSAEVPAKAGDVTLMLTAAADVKAASQPIQLMLFGIDPAKPEACVAAYNLKQEKDGAQELIEQTPAIWLTVVPAPPATMPTTKPATQATTQPLKK
jgi:hypothetical protein